MNAGQLKKNVGQHVQLRPKVMRRAPTGEPLRFRDDKWSIERVDEKGVTIHNISTGHAVTLENDNVREYRTPDFLILRCQLTLQVNCVVIEPI
jgi:hypothetical protein